MTRLSTSRRQLLGTLGALGVSGLAGCSTLSSAVTNSDDQPPGYLPGDDRLWGGPPLMLSWCHPGAYESNQDVLDDASLAAYFPREFGLPGTTGRETPLDGTGALERIEMSYTARPQGLSVLEGDVSLDVLRSVYPAGALRMTSEYKGYRFGVLETATTYALAVRDGRGIYVDTSPGLEVAWDAVQATVDTIEGDVPPYLRTKPDLGAVEKFLDRDLLWEYSTQNPAGIEGVRSMGRSFSVVDESRYRLKATYGFQDAAQVRPDAVLEFVTASPSRLFDFHSPTTRQVDSVLVLEEERTF